jgi:hypothetical protein
VARLQQLPRNFISIHDGQADIEKHHLWLQPRNRLERFERPVDRLDLVTVERQQHRKGVCRIDIVVNDEDTPRCTTAL